MIMAAVLKELNAKYNFYILSSYVEGHVMQKFKSELNVFVWFPDLKNLNVFLENLLWRKI